MVPQVGSILEGKVSSITNFGAFIALEGGGSGLVHISEIANTYVNDVHDFLEVGHAVKVLVLSAENGKVNLSIKKTLPPPERRGPRPVRTASAPPRGHARPPAPSGDPDFEDKLTHVLSSSEGKMADLNRGMDGRRGGGRRRK